MTRSTRALLALPMIAVAIIGLIDAVRDGRTDVAIIFIVLLIGTLVLARLGLQQGSVVLHGDHSDWVERTTSVTGETPDELVNRAVSRLRASFGESWTEDRG